MPGRMECLYKSIIYHGSLTVTMLDHSKNLIKMRIFFYCLKKEMMTALVRVAAVAPQAGFVLLYGAKNRKKSMKAGKQ